MRVVVVGATGNVGTGVLRRLQAEEGVRLVGVARRTPPPDAPAPYAGVEWHALDVADPRSAAPLAEAFRGADAVVLLAWLLQPNRDEPAMAATNLGGSKRVLVAAAEAGVPHVVVASSVGAYSPGPKRRRVDESWPTGGIATSHYAREKAQLERILDAFERTHPEVAVARLRPGLVMQRGAGRELTRYFLGPLVPTGLFAPGRLPVLPMPRRTVSQVVDADDLGDAFARAVLRRARGAFNVAADPVVGPREVAAVLGSRWLPVPIAPLRLLLHAAWLLRIVPVDPGWLDIAVTVPVMSTERARTELGWSPSVPAGDALAAAVRGVVDGAAQPGSPVLDERPGH